MFDEVPGNGKTMLTGYDASRMVTVGVRTFGINTRHNVKVVAKNMNNPIIMK